MDTTLLIGNGLNLTLSKESWSELLTNIASHKGITPQKGLPLPFEFERIMNLYLGDKQNIKDKNRVYSETKKEMLRELQSKISLDDDAIHKKLTELPIQNIITTNYDFLLEYAFEPGISPKIDSQTTFIDKPVECINGVNFYHAHGHAHAIKSICLGYEHYIKLVTHIRNALDKKNTHDKCGLVNNLKNNTVLNEWYYKFFSDNIYIIGLGLSESEIDLWSLLTRRASLYYRDCDGAHSAIQNRIVYYDIIDNSDENNVSKAENKYSMLEAVHVEVRKRYLKEFSNNDFDNLAKEPEDEQQKAQKCALYKKAYESIFEEIKKEAVLVKCNHLLMY